MTLVELAEIPKSPLRDNQAGARLEEPFKKSVLRIILAIAAAAFLMKCALAFFTYGTNDVDTWRNDLTKVSTEGVAALYRYGVYFWAGGKLSPVQVFSHPPAMIHVLYFWGMLANVTGLPVQFWMRFSCAIADAITLLIVCNIARREPGFQINVVSLMLLAACPVSIFISGFHGNTDPIMICFVVDAVHFGGSRAPTIAGFCFGLALCIKILPVI